MSSCVKAKHVKRAITSFGGDRNRPIRRLKRNEIRHISLQQKSCKLVVCREGNYDFLPISRRVAEELIALGFEYDC